MNKFFSTLGRFIGGASWAGACLGLLEAYYWQAPYTFATVGYATVSMFLASFAGCGWLAMRRIQHRLWGQSLTRLGAGHGFALTFVGGSFLLGHFIVWRDMLFEDPSQSYKAWLLALAIASAAATAAILLCRVCQHIQIRLAWPAARWCYAAYAVICFWSMTFAVIVQQGQQSMHQQLAPPTTPERYVAQSDSPRSVILIVTDALRRDALGCMRATQAHDFPGTPALDAFASQAQIFDNAIAQASWTKPAMASILTARPASVHQTMAKSAILPKTMRTLGTWLQRHNVSTSAVVTNYNLSRDFGFAQGFDAFAYLEPDRYLGAPEHANRLAAYNFYRLVRERYLPSLRQSRYFFQSAEQVNQEAVALLDRLGTAPFFMWLHYMEAHDPYFDNAGHSFARVSEPHPKATQAVAMQRAYQDSVARLDHALGALFQQLEARHLLERTMVIVVADHGEEFGEHGGFYHGTSLYEELIHIPLLIRGPNIPAGRNMRLAQQIDLAPTITKFLGIPQDPNWSGHDLFDGSPAPSVALSEENHEGNLLHAIRGGSMGQTFKYIHANADNPRGLPTDVTYNLNQDPNEQIPLAGDAQTRAQATLQAFAAQHVRNNPNDHFTTEETTKLPINPDAEAQLRALGYVR